MGLFGGGGLGQAIGGAVGGLLGGVGSIVSAGMSGANAAALNQANYEHQKEFAQNGIRWRVADAKAAGLHPLAALGAQTSGYTPSAVVGDSPDFSFLRDIGQDVGRAIDAKSTAAERAANKAKIDQGANLELEGKQLDNEYKRTLIASQKQDDALRLANAAVRASWSQQLPPAMPSIKDNPVVDGQAQAYPIPGTESKPAEVVTSFRGGTIQAGTNPDIAFDKTRNGGYTMRMSDSQKQANEDSIHGTAAFLMRNVLPAAFLDASSAAPPRSLLPSGGKDPDEVWTYNPWHNVYYPARRSDFAGRLNRRFNPFY